MQEVEEGHVVVLRRRTSHNVAVGRTINHRVEVAGLAYKEKKSRLKDFDGWDLPAYCYVQWHKPAKPVLARVHLAQSAICRVNNIGLRGQAEQILKEISPSTSNHDGPLPTRRIKDRGMEEFLENRLGVESAQKAVATIRNICRLAERYYSFGFRRWPEIKKPEIRTFLVKIRTFSNTVAPSTRMERGTDKNRTKSQEVGSAGRRKH